MSEENVEIVRGMYDSFHGGHAEAALSYFSPDVVVDASVRMDGGIGQGRDALIQIIGGWTTAFDDWREDIEEIRGIGHVVLVTSTQRGIARTTGMEVEARYAVLYEVRGRLITKLTLYSEVAQALKAAGLSE